MHGFWGRAGIENHYLEYHFSAFNCKNCSIPRKGAEACSRPSILRLELVPGKDRALGYAGYGQGVGGWRASIISF